MLAIWLINFLMCGIFLKLDCEAICDPPGGDTLLAEGTYLTDTLH